MLSAIIENRGNTLVVDLPCDRSDLDMKLFSIGRELSHNTPISADSKIKVKLLADNDIGTHLIKLFNDSHTMRDVNNLANAVMNAPDEVKEAIESDIINDQYSSPQELMEDVRKQTYEAGQHTETFFFPIVGMLDEEEVSNRFLCSYKWDISNLIEKEQKSDVDMKEYFDYDDNAKSKMVSAIWGVAEKKGILYGKVDFKLREPFTAEEKEKVKEWISAQNSDGFGEDLEDKRIETEDGNLYINLWSFDDYFVYDDYFIYDEEEMNEYMRRKNNL